MCGFVGFIDPIRDKSVDELSRIVSRMNDTIVHRGPDDEGVWVDAAVGLAMGHRRLSILDLSPEGHQPMTSFSGRYVVIYNGEIYNYRQIRSELEGSGFKQKWRGHSDTEVMLAAISAWGVERALEKFNGMFAAALWDKKEQKLFLFRDRLGEKPLYYGVVNNVLYFTSELKTLREHPQWTNDIDRDVLAQYLKYNYIPAPFSIYKNILKLPAAHLIEIHRDELGKLNSLSQPRLYWSAQEVVGNGLRTALLDEQEALAELDLMLRDAVKLRMEADVPLGAFLSGGFDSSLVVALMQSMSAKPVQTFSIGFYEKEYDEAMHARTVAEYLGTDHTELYINEQETMEVIPRLPVLFDEPFADSSQIPTFIVAQLAKSKVTVALSGDGGDELFCGYKRYQLLQKLWSNMRLFPSGFRSLIGDFVSSVPPQFLNKTERFFDSSFRKYGRSGKVADKLYKLADLMGAESPEDLYQGLMSHWQNPHEVVKGVGKLPAIFEHKWSGQNTNKIINMAMYHDMMSYLPDDILVKVDRCTMGVSLEARVPLLDHRLVEMAWKIPLSMKFKNNSGKWLLRQVLYQYIPEEMMNRPKMGFGVPIFRWLRGPLKDWAEELLDEKRLQQEGFFEPAPIRQKWKEHLSGERNWQYPLWDILMFQAWYSHWK